MTTGPVAASTVESSAATVGVDDGARCGSPAGTRRACRMATALPVLGFASACAADKDGPPADEADVRAVTSAAPAGGLAFCPSAAVVSLRTLDQSDGSGVAGAGVGAMGDSLAAVGADRGIMIRSDPPKH